MGKQIREPDGVLFCASADLQLKYHPLRESEHAMNVSFEEKLVDVWRQVLVENATVGGVRRKTLFSLDHFTERLAAGGFRA